MCGICGFVGGSDTETKRAGTIRAMTDRLRHRGPDDEGFHLEGPTALGVRRLSIIDLVTGQQPVKNEDGTIWLIFNGEIYNFVTLRSELRDRGHSFRSSGDTEVLVHAYEEYGLEFLKKLNGMFAIALWDKRRARLLLARDRIGIKPLYYWHGNGQIVFGSEMKALLAHPAVPRRVNPFALDEFMTLEYVSGPHTILQGISKLQPGHYLEYQDGRISIEPYWKLEPVEVPADEEDCKARLAELIEDAVKLRLVSDVPLGAFLSGGIDSSTVLYFMTKLVSEPVRAFSIGFGDSSYNELPDARRVAAQLGARHHESILRPDIGPLVERLVGHLDEPFGDVSIVPTYLVSDLASRHVKVVLSGDGGDEIFAGYETYVAQHLARLYDRLPASIRKSLLPTLMEKVPPQPAKKGILNKAKRFVEGGIYPAGLHHARWMLHMPERAKDDLYRREFRAAIEGRRATESLEAFFKAAADHEPLAQQQYVDIHSYLVDDILTKVDRMSMAASIEARVPLLDHRVVEFAWSLPPHMKLRLGESKVILRRMMQGHLPGHVLEKPKDGFSIPVKHWLRTSLRPMMEDLLSEASLNRRGYFQPQVVREWMDEHLEGRVNHAHRLWGMMVFEMWAREVLDESAAQLHVAAMSRADG